MKTTKVTIRNVVSVMEMRQFIDAPIVTVANFMLDLVEVNPGREFFIDADKNAICTIVEINIPERRPPRDKKPDAKLE